MTAARTRVIEKPPFQNWVCFPHCITAYTVLGKGTGAFSRRLLLAVGWRHTPSCSLHLPATLHPLPMLYWKKLVCIWSQGCCGSSLKVSHVLLVPRGTRTPTKPRHRGGGWWLAEFSTDQVQEESLKQLFLMFRKNLIWHLGGEKHWVQTSPWWHWVRVTAEQALWVQM